MSFDLLRFIFTFIYNIKAQVCTLSFSPYQLKFFVIKFMAGSAPRPSYCATIIKDQKKKELPSSSQNDTKHAIHSFPLREYTKKKTQCNKTVQKQIPRRNELFRLSDFAISRKERCSVSVFFLLLLQTNSSLIIWYIMKMTLNDFYSSFS